MPETWFSPYPSITLGSPTAVEKLSDLDKDINYLETILSDLKEKRKRARDMKEHINAGIPAEDLHSDYLTIIENQRRGESELSKLWEERLKLVLLADFALRPSKRGDYFPHPTLEKMAKEFVELNKNRLLAVSTVAFFGSGITFSTIFSGTRGSIGLMSLSWAAFAMSFSLCVYEQWVIPESLPFVIATHPSRRGSAFGLNIICGVCLICWDSAHGSCGGNP